MRQKNDMLHALNIALEKKQSQIAFWIGMSCLDFKHEFIATELDTWGPKIDTLDNPRQDNKPPETPNLETSELIEMFTKSMKEIANLSKSESLNRQSNSGPATTPLGTLELFNVNNPPPDVRQRHDTKTRSGLPCQNEMKPFQNNMPEARNPSKMQTMHHHLDPPVTGDRLITRDRTVFHLRDHGAKSNQMSMTSAPRCKGNEPEEIRSWCLAFTKFAAAKGKCAHLHFCF